MTLISSAITLIFVMDPLGNIPFFLSTLKAVPAKKRPAIVLRESFIAYLILLLFLLFGQYLLSAMHISQPALSIAGGIILFLISIRMIFPEVEGEEKSQRIVEPFIVPLAVPCIAGPSTMTMVMLLANQNQNDKLYLIIALTLAWSISTAILVFADYLRKLMGERGLIAMERLMGMILTTMAVQMLLSGIDQFIYY